MEEVKENFRVITRCLSCGYSDVSVFPKAVPEIQEVTARAAKMMVGALCGCETGEITSEIQKAEVGHVPNTRPFNTEI